MKPFEHSTHHHCESGAISNLYNYYGIKLSEAMVFGIGAGLFFVHSTLIKTMKAPTTSFRYLPGNIFKVASAALGVKCVVKTYSNPQKGMNALDEQLGKGKPVGLFTNMLHLNYMPEVFQFDFSAHNVIVYKKEDGLYHISDSILEFPVKIAAEQLAKARFGRGLLGAKGRMYFVESTSQNPPIAQAIKSGIAKTCNRMLRHFMPGTGYKGIHALAKNISKYSKLNRDTAVFYLINLIRMQEVTGTGGAGYRVLYAQFLKEAAVILNNKEIAVLSDELNLIATDWKNFALEAGRAAKALKKNKNVDFDSLGKLLHKIAEKEKDFFTKLSKEVK